MHKDNSPALPAGAKPIELLRHRGGSTQPVTDAVAEECPVALVFNGISHAVMMATPADLDLLAVGFALSEGIVTDATAIRDVEIVWHDDSAEVQLEIAQSAFVELKAHRRALAGRTGCGVCGIESIELLDLAPETVSVANAEAVPDQAALARILAALPAHQPLMSATGCAHAALWCRADGEIVRACEDVGRHNALDKLLGWMARSGVDSTHGFIFMTSRASYELVRKAARRNVPLLATISAPTSLAIRMAREAGMRLLSFCRKDGYAEY
jgi:FdhD protein